MSWSLRNARVTLNELLAVLDQRVGRDQFLAFLRSADGGIELFPLIAQHHRANWQVSLVGSEIRDDELSLKSPHLARGVLTSQEFQRVSPGLQRKAGVVLQIPLG